MAQLAIDGTLFGVSISAGDYLIIHNFANKDVTVKIHPGTGGANETVFRNLFDTLQPLVIDIDADSSFAWYPDNSVNTAVRLSAEYPHGLSLDVVDKTGRRYNGNFLQYTTDTA